MATRNYKVYANVGATPSTTVRAITVLDTGAGPNFIHRSKLTDELVKNIRMGPNPCINDANGRPLAIVGTIPLYVRMARYVVKVDFIVCDRLAADIVLGCDFCDRYIEAIRPRQRAVELEDGTLVPIVRKPKPRAKGLVPLPTAQQFPEVVGRTLSSY